MMQKYLNRILFILIFLFSVSIISAQKSYTISDIELINTKLSQKQNDPYKRSYIYQDEQSIIKKWNPFNLLIGGTLYFYQNILSKHISADCLFTPSCSEFCKKAIREEGFLKGTILSVDRLNRCNRIAAIDLKHYRLDIETKRYPDPVSRYNKVSHSNE